MAKGGFKLDSSSSSAGYYREPLHEKPVFQYAKLILILATLVVGILVLLNTRQITGAVVSQTISANDFISKLTAHPEAGKYANANPLNIIQINSNNLAQLQSQIRGMDTSYIGNFLVQYQDAVLVYDYNNDAVKGVIPLQQPQLPADFSAKLNAHPEMQGLEGQQPVGGQLDAQSLATLKQQFPDVYANAKIGDFLLRYTAKLIIYDYANDVIVNAVNLAAQ